LKLEEGAERYSDDPQGEGHGHEAAAMHTEEATAESTKLKLQKQTVQLLQNLLKLKKLQKLNTN
jgi:hypothetical protein